MSKRWRQDRYFNHSPVGSGTMEPGKSWKSLLSRDLMDGQLRYGRRDSITTHFESKMEVKSKRLTLCDGL
jgi:hypothetical protein